MTIIAQFALSADTAKKIHDTLVDCISNEETRYYFRGVKQYKTMPSLV